MIQNIKPEYHMRYQVLSCVTSCGTAFQMRLGQWSWCNAGKSIGFFRAVLKFNSARLEHPRQGFLPLGMCGHHMLGILNHDFQCLSACWV